jgi:hypothetical protein
MMTLKPCQKRRLAAEQAIYRRGFNNFREVADACNEFAKKCESSVTFNRLAVQQYVGCQTNLSMKRLKLLAEMLGITNYQELDEIFTAPVRRGCGEYWLGESGNKIKDLDMSMMDRFNSRF